MLSSDRMLLQNSYTSVIVSEEIDFVSITFINTSLPGLMIIYHFLHNVMPCMYTKSFVYCTCSFILFYGHTYMTMIITKVGLVQRIDDIHLFKH